MQIISDLSGQTYGLWRVLGNPHRRNKKTYWDAECTGCRRTKAIEAYGLVTGRSKACRPCSAKVVGATIHKTHGMAKTIEYRTYQAARTRCRNPKAKDYEYWGGRGIEFRFTSFEQFFTCLGLRPSCIHTLDRIDNNGHYEPDNVRWTTYDVQAKNKRPYKKRAPRITGIG